MDGGAGGADWLALSSEKEAGCAQNCGGLGIPTAKQAGKKKSAFSPVKVYRVLMRHLRVMALAPGPRAMS